MEYQSGIKDYLDREIAVLKDLDISMIERAMQEIKAAYDREGTIYIFGNGGSASTASHYANDFTRALSQHLDKKFCFICLNDNIPTMLAIANDFGYDEIFRLQLEGRLTPRDLVIAISCSGNSSNVVKAINYAREQNVRTMGILGFDGGELLRLVDVSLHVPVKDMQISEDIHLIFDHLMMRVFMKNFSESEEKC